MTECRIRNIDVIFLEKNYGVCLYFLHYFRTIHFIELIGMSFDSTEIIPISFGMEFHFLNLFFFLRTNISLSINKFSILIFVNNIFILTDNTSVFPENVSFFIDKKPFSVRSFFYSCDSVFGKVINIVKWSFEPLSFLIDNIFYSLSFIYSDNHITLNLRHKCIVMTFFIFPITFRRFYLIIFTVECSISSIFESLDRTERSFYLS